MNKTKILEARNCLIDNGVSRDEAMVVLEALVEILYGCDFSQTEFSQDEWDGK